MAVQFSDTTFQALLLTSILPIISFALIMIFTRENPKLSLGISLTASTIPLIIAWWLLFKYWGIQEPLIYNFKWLYSDMVKIPFGFLLDPTSLLMLTIVASISWMVQVYSIGYMDGDPGFGRFYAFLVPVCLFHADPDHLQRSFAALYLLGVGGFGLISAHRLLV